MRNRFQGLDLIECLMNYGQRFVTFTGDRDQDHPHGNEMQKSKMAVWGGLTNAVKRREAKSKGEKERYAHLNAEFQRIAKRDKKAVLSDQCKEIEENKEWERLEISSRKLEIPREHWRRQWQPTPVLLPGKSHGRRSLVGYSPWGH